MTNLENALFWLYVKTWGKYGEHVINEKALWTFSAEDLRAALMEITYPRKGKFKPKENSERVTALIDLIMEKFVDFMAFREWSMEIYEENNGNLSETVLQQGPYKILKWDSGNYLRHKIFPKFADNG